MRYGAGYCTTARCAAPTITTSGGSATCGRIVRFRTADAALAKLSARFDRRYAGNCRPSIPPVRRLRAPLLQAFYVVRAERHWVQQTDYSLATAARARSARWFGIMFAARVVPPSSPWQRRPRPSHCPSCRARPPRQCPRRVCQAGLGRGGEGIVLILLDG
jgi:hypothetical protein